MPPHFLQVKSLQAIFKLIFSIIDTVQSHVILLPSSIAIFQASFRAEALELSDHHVRYIWSCPKVSLSKNLPPGMVTIKITFTVQGNCFLASSHPAWLAYSLNLASPRELSWPCSFRQMHGNTGLERTLHPYGKSQETAFVGLQNLSVHLFSFVTPVVNYKGK